jgi:lipoate-protein ligase B
VKRWITLHGFALNVSTDLGVFDQVVPCGIDGVVMTRVQDVLGRSSESGGELWDATMRAIVDGFGSAFDRPMVASEPAELGTVLRDPAM